MAVLRKTIATFRRKTGLRDARAPSRRVAIVGSYSGAESHAASHDREHERTGLKFSGPSPTLTGNMSKDASLVELAHIAHLMIPGSLSEVTRQCGDPSCACALRPIAAPRPAPVLEVQCRAARLTPSTCPLRIETRSCRPTRPGCGSTSSASQMAEDNRQRLLHELGSHKEVAKAQRAKSRARA